MRELSSEINKSYQFSKFFTKTSLNSRKIDFLILHHIEASCAKTAIEMLKQHQVSSHFLIDEKGEIFQLVDENDIAYHAGHSFWRGVDGLNPVSIGIEFVNQDAFGKNFSDKQMKSGLKLCKYLLAKYNIAPENIAAHSDIAYFKKDFIDENGMKLGGFLDRKNDPSHFFDWSFLAKNGVGIYPSRQFQGEEEILHKFGEENPEISEVKNKLAKIGYKINNFDGIYDIETQLLVRVFNRRFNQDGYKLNPDIWWKSSQFALDYLGEFFEF